MHSKDQSTSIPLGEMHALENPGVVALELIGVQPVSFLADNFMRFEDRYG